MNRFFVSTLAFIAVFNCASAIICYECNSVKNPQCTEDVLPDNLRRNCSELDRGNVHTLCRKVIQQVEHEINGYLPKSRVIRSCGWDESKFKDSCYHRGGFGGRQEVCACTTDLCNDASDGNIKHALFLAIVFIRSIF